MPINIDNTYRINRSQTYEEAMRYLLRDLKIFESYSQLLTISAVIGYVNDTYVPFTDNAESVQITFFTPRQQELMNLLAYAKAGNQSILQEKPKDDPDHNKMYEAFEFYANGGFPILLTKLGVDTIDKSKNDRYTILNNYYSMLVSNDLINI